MLFLKKYALMLALVGIAIFASFHTTAHAQTPAQPQLLITWQAGESYVPPGYHDKALPNTTSRITASAALISAQGSLDLSNQTIYWYQNDTLIGNGPTVTFEPFGGAPNFITLKAQIPSYNGNILVNAIQIPVVQPKAVIEANHPTAQFNNSSLALQGTPYFFNVADASSLAYAWSVNGASPSAAIDPQTLDLSVNPNTAAGSSFATTLSITDPQRRMSASDEVNLAYLKQL